MYPSSTSRLESYRWDYHMVTVEGGSYDCVTMWKRTNWSKSYGLKGLYDCGMKKNWHYKKVLNYL